MQRNHSLIRGFFYRYMIGVVCSTLAIGLFWLYSSHQELLNETKILREQAVQRQMSQLKERVEHVLEMIQHERQQLDSQMREQIRQRTLEAHAVMENIYQASKDQYPPEQIAAMVRNSLRAIKYNAGRGYFFATGMDGIEQLFPPNPKLEGRSFLNIRDMNGKLVVQDMIALINEQQEGFYEYSWTKPGAEGQHPKIAYIKYFAPLNWLVGTGEYVDDLISDLQNELIRRIENIKFKDGGYVFAADYTGLSLSYPAKGRNMHNVSDSNGLKIVQELIKLAKAGGGYQRYVMPPFKGERPEPKISYVTGIQDWGWYLGSGDFVADLDHELATMLAEQEAAIHNKMATIVGVLMLFLLFGLFLSRQLGRQISVSFQTFQEFFTHAASNAQPLNVGEQSFEEFETLAESANQMLEERHHFEQEANEYRNQMRNVIDAMPSILVTINTDGRVTQWNKFAAASTGISQSDAEHKKLPLLLPYLQPSLGEILATTCNQQQIFQAEVETSQQGDVRNKHISAYPLGSPTPHSIVIRVDDITERKMLEKTLVQSEKMLSVGGLAAGMAHEVNNPLAAIMQGLQLLRNRLTTDNPKTRKMAQDAQLDLAALQNFLAAGGVPEKLDNAIASCNRAATIVKDMLNFSRETQSNFTATDVAKLLDSTLKLLANDYDLHRHYSFRDINIDCHVAEAMSAVVCEANQIQQVIFNLLKNGAQAMSEANIPLAKRRFEIDIHEENRMAVIRIADSGPGMPEGIRKRIFEPFFTTKAVGKGTGLGLFVSYFIIHENHGGDIRVDSTLGQGTTFTIKLPLQQTQKH